jgi:hypothetical protein
MRTEISRRAKLLLLRGSGWRRRFEFGVIDRHVLLQLIDLDGETIVRTCDGPPKRHLHAVGVAVISIVDLGGDAAKRGFRVTD